MKTKLRFLSLLLLLVLVIGSFSACVEPGEGSGTTEPSAESVDYVSELKLDMTSDTKKQEVTVKTFVDGDTTHFNVPHTFNASGILKARYLAVNTPESTGKIEKWGKRAAAFTRSKLENAYSILVESDDSSWNLDSTGGRYLVWVWYKTDKDSEYRNLNLEILQNGLCIASSTANNRYGETCMAALNQAKAQKLFVYSKDKDEDFYEGDAIELSLIELRTNIEKYSNVKVAFEGVITLNDNNSIYIEEYDPETDMYYGISVYYGYGMSGNALEILNVGNRSRIVGTVQYYEAGGTYQVSGLQYSAMKPNDPSNIQKISDGHSPAYVKTDADRFVNGKVEAEVTTDDDTVEKKIFDYAYLAMNTSILMENLQVKSIYTTSNPESTSFGAMTLTCTVDGVTVDVRTTVFRDANGQLITEAAYAGKNITVRGIVDYYDGEYQILVLTPEDITING